MDKRQRRAVGVLVVCVASLAILSAQVDLGLAQYVNGAGVARGVITAPRVVNNGAAPGVSTCGTGSVTTGSTDVAGQIVATGATACTVTFAVAYGTAAFCTITDDTTVGKGIITAQSASAFTVSSLTSGDTFQYVCGGK